jgi:hypothetical protein
MAATHDRGPRPSKRRRCGRTAGRQLWGPASGAGRAEVPSLAALCDKAEAAHPDLFASEGGLIEAGSAVLGYNLHRIEEQHVLWETQLTDRHQLLLVYVPDTDACFYTTSLSVCGRAGGCLPAEIDALPVSQKLVLDLLPEGFPTVQEVRRQMALALGCKTVSNKGIFSELQRAREHDDHSRAALALLSLARALQWRGLFATPREDSSLAIDEKRGDWGP